MGHGTLLGRLSPPLPSGAWGCHLSSEDSAEKRPMHGEAAGAWPWKGDGIWHLVEAPPPKGLLRSQEPLEGQGSVSAHQEAGRAEGVLGSLFTAQGRMGTPGQTQRSSKGVSTQDVSPPAHQDLLEQNISWNNLLGKVWKLTFVLWN